MEHFLEQYLKKMPIRLQQLIAETVEVIECWYQAWGGNVSIQFSGGIDSTVLVYIAIWLYPDIPLHFANTGLEYPELVKFVRTFDNVIEVRPKRSFKWVLENKGYPVVSKKTAKMIRNLRHPHEKNQNLRRLYLEGITSDGRQCKSYLLAEKWKKLISAPFETSEACCDFIKKEPLHRLEKQTGRKPMIAVMAADGQARKFSLKGQECNLYDSKRPISRPMKNWTKQDVLEFLFITGLPYASVYGTIGHDKKGNLTTTGEDRTGCMFCMFGVHLEKEPNRFQRMELSHPKHYRVCMDKLGCRAVLEFIGVPYRNRQLSFNFEPMIKQDSY